MAHGWRWELGGGGVMGKEGERNLGQKERREIRENRALGEGQAGVAEFDGMG